MMEGPPPRPDGPLTHIARTALPWRDDALSRTICGHPVSQYAEGRVVNLKDARGDVRRLGRQRFALLYCMTCASWANRWAEWDADPVARMEREITGGAFGKREPIVVHELRAIAALIAAHEDEFREFVQAFASGEVISLADHKRTAGGR